MESWSSAWFGRAIFAVRRRGIAYGLVLLMQWAGWVP